MAMVVLMGTKMMSMDQFEQAISGEPELSSREVLSYKGNDKLRVVIQEPLRKPRIELIGRGYEEKQRVVGGGFETIPLGDTDLDIYLNEEGKFEGLMPNLKFFDDGKLLDITVGTILVGKVDDEGESVSLSPDECFRAITELNNLTICDEHEAMHYQRQIARVFG